MAYIAIDIGASSGRHILADLVDGKIVTREIYRFPNGPKRLENGSLIWDIDNLFYQIKQGLKEAGKLGEKIDYVAIDTWGVDYALLDEKLKIVIDYRIKYPETSLNELSEIITKDTGKNITKSGLNHRFRKIKEIVTKLENKDWK